MSATTTPIVKQEGEEFVLKPESNISDADARLLLAFHMHDNRDRASTPPLSTSRVSIQALLNAVEDDPLTIPVAPASAPPRISTFSRVASPPVASSSRLFPQPPAISHPPKPRSKTKSLVTATADAMPGSSRATKSMSISVEPEPLPVPAPKPKPKKTKPPKLGKGRGRVSKGPKKREGKGWVIESCTTSGAASDAGSEAEVGPGQTMQGLGSKIDPVVLKEVFGSDSDLTELESEESSSSEEEEYDLGLAGLPPVPVSSDSEYEPANGASLNPNGHETRVRRSAKVDYEEFQSSARPSVRIAATRATPSEIDRKSERASRTRSPAKSEERAAEAEVNRTVRRKREPKSAADSPSEPTATPGPCRTLVRASRIAAASGNSSKPGSDSPLKPSKTAGSRLTKSLPKRRPKPASMTASSVSLGEWQDDPPNGAKGTVPLTNRSGSSSLSELTESSPSLGGRRDLDSPLLGSTMELGGANLSSRSDGGVTHVSESVEGHIETDGSDRERTRRWEMTRAMEMEPRASPGVTVRDFVHPPMRERRASESDRHRDQWKQPVASGSRSNSSPIKPSRHTSSSDRDNDLPPPQSRKSPKKRMRSTSGRLSFPPPVEVDMMHAVPIRLQGRHRDLLVFMPTRDKRFLSVLSEESGSGASSMTGSSAESKTDISEEPPTKRMRRVMGVDKGKGKAVDDDESVQGSRKSGRARKPSTRLLDSRGEKAWDGDRIEFEDGTQWPPSKRVNKRQESLSVSGRSRRGPKPTVKSLESLRQQDAWDDGQHRRATKLKRGSKRVIDESEMAESLKSQNTRVDSKRSGTEVSESKPVKKPRQEKAITYSLREGDFILRPQEKRCFHYEYDQTIVPRCLACRKKKVGDTCRFVRVRWLQLDHKTLDPVGVKFDSPAEGKATIEYHLPGKWNVTPTIQQVERMQIALAHSLHPVLLEELTHALKPGVIRRAVEIEVRATCDVCATSVFSSCHMCTRCGRELCGGCFERVVTMCPLGTPIEYHNSADRKDPQLHKYRACAAGRIFHVPADFRPVTRFMRDELEQTVREMDELIAEANQLEQSSTQDKVSHWVQGVALQQRGTSPQSTEPPALSSAGSSHDISSIRGTPDPTATLWPCIVSPSLSPTHEVGFNAESPTEPGKRPVATQSGRIDPAGVPSHPIASFSRELSEDEFKPLWAKGEAVVVHDLLDKFDIRWTPDYFINEYGQQNCLVVDCDTNKVQETYVAEFFEKFGQADRELGILKLKDWPAQADFKDDFPALFDDFMKALPVPNYTRRDGILNVASHFATNAIAPDLGPKMYNAFASSEGPGGQGSTRLHMDMADAVNIMMFASDCADGSPGVAAWDIFRACDSEKIRAYLRRHFEDRSNEFRDPIHSQLFYLDSDHRKRLYEEEKVYSWRIYQRPGDAVFIPAGCAHQVCNLADCIKVAIDFVSLENIDRCEKLTAEFRNENDTFTWKEDVLQLRTMMMYAWRSTRQLRAVWDEACEQGGDEEPSEEQSMV